MKNIFAIVEIFYILIEAEIDNRSLLVFKYRLVSIFNRISNYILHSFSITNWVSKHLDFENMKVVTSFMCWSITFYSHSFIIYLYGQRMDEKLEASPRSERWSRKRSIVQLGFRQYPKPAFLIFPSIYFLSYLRRKSE